jgi:hypothetical protein
LNSFESVVLVFQRHPRNRGDGVPVVPHNPTDAFFEKGAKPNARTHFPQGIVLTFPLEE